MSSLIWTWAHRKREEQTEAGALWVEGKQAVFETACWYSLTLDEDRGDFTLFLMRRCMICSCKCDQVRWQQLWKCLNRERFCARQASMRMKLTGLCYLSCRVMLEGTALSVPWSPLSIVSQLLALWGTPNLGSQSCDTGLNGYHIQVDSPNTWTRIHGLYALQHGLWSWVTTLRG